MDLIGLAIKRPMVVTAAVLMILVLGLVALKTIPIQLTPDLRRPVLYITTYWSGAAPLDVEREVTNRIEAELVGLKDLLSMSSTSGLGRSRIHLEFGVGQNMDRAFMLVSNRLSQVTDLPDDAGRPSVWTSGSDDVPIARLALTRRPGNSRDIETYGELVEDVVADRLQRVPGVSSVSQAGGSRRTLQVIVTPEVMAGYGLTVPKLLQVLRDANISLSAGAVDEGKRRYIVRTDSETASVAQLKAVVLQTSYDAETGRLADVTVDDIADVRLAYDEPDSHRRINGEPMIRLNVVRETGANVIETMAGVRRAVDRMNDGLLAREGLELALFYDETLYIESAIDLVAQNIWLGGALAALVLLLFLRSWRATAVVVLSIPISVIAAFVIMALAGRSLNVISLAGIAFAVGMVVDAAIVVLENVFRLRQQGVPARMAALTGARQVWGAILASAVTTVVVFIPILLLELPAGQLFRDIAVALSVSVLLSLLVAVTVIPALANRLLDRDGGAERRLRLPLIDTVAGLFVRGVLAAIGAVIVSRPACLLLVGLVCGAAALATYFFMPKLDYLPDGNRNFVIARLQPPPGYNLDTTFDLAERIEAATKPLWSKPPDASPSSGPLSPAASDAASDAGPPDIENFYFLALRNFTMVGASARDIARAGELVPVLRDAVAMDPGTKAFVSQSSIFGRGLGGARSIRLVITGPDIDAILDTARRADDLLAGAFGPDSGIQTRVRPGLELGAPEIRVTPDLRRLANAEMTARDLALSIDVMNDGAKVTEVNLGSRRVEVTLMGPKNRVRTTQGIANLPIVTGAGQVLPAGSLARIDLTTGPTQIVHAERERAVSIQVKPPRGLALEDAIQLIRSDVVAPLEADAPPGLKLALSGAADNLTKTWNALQLNLVVAIFIVYLVIAVLYESLVYPLIILLSVPLATAGGLLALALLNIWSVQPLDMLTMLGFVILIGIVVNNAILLVDQALQNSRGGMGSADAIVAATRNRIRPIFMSSLTSICGLLPLAVFPGAGSELYRGLGTVVIGGLTLSAVLTLAIIPPLLALLLPRRPELPAEAEMPLRDAAQ